MRARVDSSSSSLGSFVELVSTASERVSGVGHAQASPSEEDPFAHGWSDDDNEDKEGPSRPVRADHHQAALAETCESSRAAATAVLSPLVQASNEADGPRTSSSCAVDSLLPEPHLVEAGHHVAQSEASGGVDHGNARAEEWKAPRERGHAPPTAVSSTLVTRLLGIALLAVSVALVFVMGLRLVRTADRCVCDAIQRVLQSSTRRRGHLLAVLSYAVTMLLRTCVCIGLIKGGWQWGVTACVCVWSAAEFIYPLFVGEVGVADWVRALRHRFGLSPRWHILVAACVYVLPWLGAWWAARWWASMLL